MANNTLKTRIQDDMKSAMRAKDKIRLGTIRMLMAAVKQREIDEQITLDDAEVLAVINKMIKQRRDAAEQYSAAGRAELAAKEQQEIKTLETYLPTQLSDQEVDAAVQQAIQKTGAKSMQDMGKVMGVLKNQLAGQADMAKVSAKVKSHLS